MLASFEDTRELRRRSQQGKNDIPVGAKAKFAFCARPAMSQQRGSPPLPEEPKYQVVGHELALPSIRENVGMVNKSKSRTVRTTQTFHFQLSRFQ